MDEDKQELTTLKPTGSTKPSISREQLYKSVNALKNVGDKQVPTQISSGEAVREAANVLKTKEGIAKDIITEENPVVVQEPHSTDNQQ